MLYSVCNTQLNGRPGQNNCMTFNKDKCKALYLGENNPQMGLSGWGLTVWGAAFLKKVSVSRVTANSTWITCVPWQQQWGQTVSRTVSPKVQSTQPGMWFSLFTQHLSDRTVGLPSSKMAQKNWRGFRGRLWKWSGGWSTWHVDNREGIGMLSVEKTRLSTI